jgi:predicted transcriptional regulator
MTTFLRKQGHQSIKKLSEILKRDYKNTHTDVKAMQEIGLIEKDTIVKCAILCIQAKA